MKTIVALATMILAACGTVTLPQTSAPPESATQKESAAPAQTAIAPQTVVTQAQPSAVAGIGVASDGLGDLGAMTFACPRAGLNAAAREAAKVPTQGTYQFAYYKIINDSHHSIYEVHFKSNYHGEPDLKYCVAIYCQQGIDPKTSKTSVTLIGPGQPSPASAADAVHKGECGNQHAPAKRRSKR